MNSPQFDIAIIGAGISGLTCAQALQKAGYTVVILEKSRGVGGRVATRQTDNYRVDHGARYLEPTGTYTENLIQNLQQQNSLQLWTDTVYEWVDNQLQPSLHQSPKYIAPDGMNTVGKYLAEDLDIWFNRRVINIKNTQDKTWYLLLEQTHRTANEKPLEVQAKLVVVAIPAPQALMLLEPLENQIDPDITRQVRSVEYDPCITVMAGYTIEQQSAFLNREIDWKAVIFPNDEVLDWVGLDSSKRTSSQPPTVVIHSDANFANKYLDTIDLEPVGKQLIQAASTYLMPELNYPEWMKVHRWRYAFCPQSLPMSCLMTTVPLPLVCAGDWCGGQQIEGALASGKAAADWVKQQLS
ncbi:MAG: FAD-dependent oxidoreductase [Microcoleaceae cyanobacterium]